MKAYPRFYAPSHPLSPSDGRRTNSQTREARVMVHRAVLYDAIGPGTHRCHWCGRCVTWMTGPGRGTKPGELVADHVDGDPTNNCTDNLVPACQRCNAFRSSGKLVADDEAYVLSGGRYGNRCRAERRTCAICGAEFLHMLAKRDPKKGRTCSRSCANKLRWREGGAIGRKAAK